MKQDGSDHTVIHVDVEFVAMAGYKCKSFGCESMFQFTVRRRNPRKRPNPLPRTRRVAIPNAKTRYARSRGCLISHALTLATLLFVLLESELSPAHVLGRKFKVSMNRPR
jgi:hypothetical protein